MDLDTLKMVEYLHRDRDVEFYITEMLPIQVSFDDAITGTQLQESQFDSYRLESNEEFDELLTRMDGQVGKMRLGKSFPLILMDKVGFIVCIYILVQLFFLFWEINFIPGFFFFRTIC